MTGDSPVMADTVRDEVSDNGNVPDSVDRLAGFTPWVDCDISYRVVNHISLFAGRSEADQMVRNDDSRREALL